jgi:glucosyl-dolichyl phosphate glucuronosyltransferase
MSISVILCTYNRCGSLANALDSVAASALPTSVEWEVLVVDNNSTDQTRQVVEDFCRRYPGRFRYLLEPQQGVSYARNAGIRESRGEVVAFMDDDVTVDPEWLWKLTASLHWSEWAGVGGRIIPIWDCSPPNWLAVDEAHSFGPFVAFDRGSEAGQLNEPPFGANMAFRREVFEKYGVFRTDLGRSGSNLLSNEDTEFGRRLLAGGERLRYEPSAVMRHPVTDNRLRKDYLLAWWFAKGRADTTEMGIPTETTWLLGGIPLRLYPRLAKWTLRWVTTIDSKRRFSRKLNVWNIAGQIAGFRQLSLHANGGRRTFIEHRR